MGRLCERSVSPENRSCPPPAGVGCLSSPAPAEGQPEGLQKVPPGREAHEPPDRRSARPLSLRDHQRGGRPRRPGPQERSPRRAHAVRRRLRRRRLSHPVLPHGLRPSGAVDLVEVGDQLVRTVPLDLSPGGFSRYAETPCLPTRSRIAWRVLAVIETEMTAGGAIAGREDGVVVSRDTGVASQMRYGDPRRRRARMPFRCASEPARSAHRARNAHWSGVRFVSRMSLTCGFL